MTPRDPIRALTPIELERAFDLVRARGMTADAAARMVLARRDGGTRARPAGEDGDAGARPHVDIVRLSEIAPRTVEWVWPGRLPRGRLVDLAGDPGAGKSTMTIDWAARITTGRAWPDGAPCPTGDVLMLTAEDGLDDTVRPRVDAAGGDPYRVHVLRAIGGAHACLADTAHVHALRDAMREIRPAMVVIDPIAAYLAGTDTHRDAEVRSVLALLAAAADESAACVVMVRHLRKSATDRAIYRAGGSIAFVAAARVQMLAGHPPDDDTRRALAVTKSNLAPLAPTLGYRVADGRIVWTGTTDVRVADILAAEEREEDRTARDMAMEYLVGALADGPRAAREIQAEARQIGISDRTLRRALRALGGRARRSGGIAGAGRWEYLLPAPPPPGGGAGSPETDEFSATAEVA